MKNVLQMLSAEERDGLVRLYDHPDWKSFRKLIDLERLELAKDHVGQRDIQEICDLSGQAKSLQRLVQTIHHNFKEINKPKKEG